MSFVQRLGNYNDLIIEFIGTFFLVLTIGMIKANDVKQEGCLAIGSVLMVCIFAGGHISGAHYNPAVTFGIWLSGRNKITTSKMFQYWWVQLVGSLAASFTYLALTDHAFAQKPENSTAPQAFIAEFLFTFLLVHVVLNTATTKSNADNSFYGLAIGFTVTGGCVAVGGVSGGVFNPAVGFGPILINAISSDDAAKLQNMWIFFLAPMCGAAFSSLVFKATNFKREFRPDGMQTLDLPLMPTTGHDTPPIGLNEAW